MEKRCDNLLCSKLFVISKKSPKQKYCSKSCCIEAKYPKIQIKCNNYDCNHIISVTPSEHNNKKYCSKSCSAKINNRLTPKRKPEDKLKKLCCIHLSKNIIDINNSDIEILTISISELYKKYGSITKVIKHMNVTEYYFDTISHIIKKQNLFKNKNNKNNKIKNIKITKTPKPKKMRVCFHCGGELPNQLRKFCDKHTQMYSNNGKALYKFTFKVSDYPDLFDLSLIDKYGWYSPGAGKCSLPKNINGISRDHKISVNDAIKYNYDPYYIKHPCNCQLMLHDENNKKNTKSSITYLELIKLVNEYEKYKN